MLQSTRKIKLLIFFTCFAFYLVFWLGHQVSIDGVIMFQYAKTLLFQRSLVMAPPVVWGSKFPISRWPIGLTLAYIPFLFFWSKIPGVGGKRFIRPHYDPLVRYNDNYFFDNAYQYASLLHPLVTALTAVFVFELGQLLGLSKKKSVAAALAFGLASPAAVYTRFDYAQPLASLLILASIVWLLQARKKGRLYLALSGFAAGLAGLTRPENFLIPGALLCLAAALMPLPATKVDKLIWRRLQNMLWLVFSMMFGVYNFLLWNKLRYGNWFFTGYWGVENSFVFDLPRNLTALAANLISPGRGIFIFFPLGLLAIPGLLRLVRRDAWSGWLLGATLIGAWSMYSTWYQWGAGISWGPRFLIPLFPYLAVLSWFGLEAFKTLSGRVRAVLWLALALLGIAPTLQGLLNHPIAFYSPFLFTPQEIMDGLYHFSISKSPIFSGWEYLFDPTAYENTWIRAAQGEASWIAGLYICFALTAGCMLIWVRFFCIADKSRGNY